MARLRLMFHDHLSDLLRGHREPRFKSFACGDLDHVPDFCDQGVQSGICRVTFGNCPKLPADSNPPPIIDDSQSRESAVRSLEAARLRWIWGRIRYKWRHFEGHGSGSRHDLHEFNGLREECNPRSRSVTNP